MFSSPRARRFARLATLVFALGLTFTACGDDDDGGAVTSEGGETSETSAAGAADVETITDGTLTVCSDIPYAPFEYEENGELKGIDIDLVKAIAEDMGLEAEFKDTDFDGIFAALAANSCDMIASSVSITDERKEVNNFSAGYFEINQSLLVRKADAATYKDLASLRGKTVGVQSETTGAAYAQEQAGTAGYQVREFTGADELFTALKAGQIDGVVQDFPINSYNAETTGETEVSAVFDTEEAEQYGFVIPKDNEGLLEAVDAALAELRSNGTYDRVLEQYLGAKATES